MERVSSVSLNCCLFCLGSCESSGEEQNGDKFGGDGGGSGRATLHFPGAGNCKLLNKQLEQIFIVRKLLGLEGKWCGEILQENTVAKDKDVIGGKGGYGIHCWFNVCSKCIRISVQPAWEIYQKMMRLEKKMNGFKDQIKRTMKENILKNKQNKSWSGLTGDGVDVKIREKIFPDLIEQKTKETPPVANPRQRHIEKCGIPSKHSILSNNDPKEDDVQATKVNSQDQDDDWEPPPIDDYFDNDDLSISPPTSAPPPKPKVNKFARKKRLRKRKPRRPRESLQRFLCPKCGCYCRSNEDLSSHLIAHEESEALKSSNYQVCSKCTFPARSQEELETHRKRRHNRARYFTCPRITCGFKAPSFIKFQQHMKQIHSSDVKQEEINLQCEACPRIFSRLEQFTLHQKKMHPELFGMASKEPVECEQCGQKFLSKIRLDYHIFNEHTEKPAPRYQCDLCGKGFAWKSRLESHKSSHFKKVKRDFICHLCGLDYTLKELLQKHYKKVHEREETDEEKKEEIFKCKHCDLTSAYRVVIQRHSQVHKRELGHECKLCGNFYTSGQGLKRHLRLNHSGTQNVKCPHCRKGFTSQDSMRDHVRNFCRLKNLEVYSAEGGDQFGGDPPQQTQNVMVDYYKVNFNE